MATVLNPSVSSDHSNDNGVGASEKLALQPRSALTEEMLARFKSRAPIYDKENRFFTEDFEELRASKYLLSPVPTELGGVGMRLADVCREQRRLAYYAPATALAVNMHLYWLGVAADLWRAMRRSSGCFARRWPARSLPPATLRAETTFPFCSRAAKAERVEGGYRFTGRKPRQPESSVDSLWNSRHGCQQSQPAENHSRVHAA